MIMRVQKRFVTCCAIFLSVAAIPSAYGLVPVVYSLSPASGAAGTVVSINSNYGNPQHGNIWMNVGAAVSSAKLLHSISCRFRVPSLLFRQ
jgi:hypothetical protein